MMMMTVMMMTVITKGVVVEYLDIVGVPDYKSGPPMPTVIRPLACKDKTTTRPIGHRVVKDRYPHWDECLYGFRGTVKTIDN